MRRRLKSLEVSPEDIGLCGCWRIAAVERLTIDLSKAPSEQTPLTEIACYVCSKTKAEMDDTALLEAIVGPLGGHRERHPLGARRHFRRGPLPGSPSYRLDRSRKTSDLASGEIEAEERE